VQSWAAIFRLGVYAPLGSASVYERSQIGEPDPYASRTQLDDLDLSSLVTAPKRIGAHTRNVGCFRKADHLVDCEVDEGVRRKLIGWDWWHRVARAWLLLARRSHNPTDRTFIGRLLGFRLSE
jgi:hypothetical protein